MGPKVASPIHLTPLQVVLYSSSTMIRPLESSSIPTASRFRPLVTGLRPMATRTTSASSWMDRKRSEKREAKDSSEFKCGFDTFPGVSALQHLGRASLAEHTHSRLLSTLSILNFKGDLSVFLLSSENFGSKLELQSLLLQSLLEVLAVTPKTSNRRVEKLMSATRNDGVRTGPVRKDPGGER